MKTTAQVIPFRNQELLLVNNSGEAFVPMKPVVEGMGLDWKTQHRKLMSGRFEACMVEMTIQLPNDNQRRAVTCLPLRKLTGWLMSIHPNKVRPELRDGIIAYQNECDDVLWSYWNDGMAVRHDDRNINTLLGQTIGTDGFRCLGAVLEGKLVNIPKPDRKRIKHHIWSQVHKAFSVVSAQDIPASSMDAARNFIAAYAIEGEWIGSDEAGNQEAAERVDLFSRVARHRWKQLDQLSERQDRLLKQQEQLLDEQREISKQISHIRTSLYDPLFESARYLKVLTGGIQDSEGKARRVIDLQDARRMH